MAKFNGKDSQDLIGESFGKLTPAPPDGDLVENTLLLLPAAAQLESRQERQRRELSTSILL